MTDRAPLLSIRLPMELYDIIRSVADTETRSMQRQVLHYIKRCLREDGLLDEKKPAG